MLPSSGRSRKNVAKSIVHANIHVKVIMFFCLFVCLVLFLQHEIKAKHFGKWEKKTNK